LNNESFTLSKYSTGIFCALALPVLYFISRYNYNLFHSLADGVSIVIAVCIFTIIWNGRRIVDNDYFLYVGIAFLFFAFLDLMHLLGNKNMGVFPEYGNLGPALYIASRYVLSISLMIAPLFINRKLNTTVMFAVYSLVTSLILLSIFYWRIFPVCIVEGVGLTPFKIASDYIICLFLLGAMGLLLIKRRSFDPGVLRTIVSSIILSIVTGFAFTLYTDAFGIMNMAGHSFQIASFYLFYLAFIETSLTKPQDILYRKLKQREEKLAENVHELDCANIELKQEMAERKRAEEALRENEEALRQSEERLQLVIKGSNDAPWDWDLISNEVYYSPQWWHQLGYAPHELPADAALWQRLIHPEDQKHVNSILKDALESKDGYEIEASLLHKDGHYLPVLSRGFITRDETGNPIRVTGTNMDLFERKQAEEQIKASLKEKEVLLSEVHHRVKNNMQVIISLLRLQSSKIEDKRYAAMFKDSEDRIKSMALIHEKLYRTKDFAKIDFNDYAKGLANHLIRTYSAAAGKIRLNTNIEDIHIGFDKAIPCGLIINELISNSLKYAFPKGEKGEIKIVLRAINSHEVELTVRDDGIGLSKEMDIRKTESLGLQLVHILAEDQLDGTLSVDREEGAAFKIRFKNH